MLNWLRRLKLPFPSLSRFKHCKIKRKKVKLRDNGISRKDTSSSPFCRFVSHQVCQKQMKSWRNDQETVGSRNFTTKKGLIIERRSSLYNLTPQFPADSLLPQSWLKSCFVHSIKQNTSPRFPKLKVLKFLVGRQMAPDRSLSAKTNVWLNVTSLIGHCTLANEHYFHRKFNC